MAAISVALVAGPVWTQGALTLADLPGLDETDATSDIAVVEDFDNPRTPLKGELIPVLGVVAFYDINWDERWTSTVGYSLIDLDHGGTAVQASFRYRYSSYLGRHVGEFVR